MKVIQHTIKYHKTKYIPPISFKDGFIISQEHQKLYRMIAEKFSDACCYFDRLGIMRESWMKNNITLHDTKYEWDFYIPENVKKEGYFTTHTKGKVVGKLIINIVFIQ